MSSRKVVDLRAKKPGIPRRTPVVPRGEDTYERPKSPLRKRRMRARILIALGSVVAVVVVAIVVSALSYLPRFTITQVAVTGTDAMSPDTIKEYAEARIGNAGHPFISQSDIFFYPKAEIEQAIRAGFPRVADVHISRASMLAQAVTVVVTERKPYAKWCDGGNCFVLDSTGFIFAEGASSMAATPVVFSGPLQAATSSPIGQYVAPGHFNELSTLIQRLAETSLAPTSIQSDASADYAVTLADGLIVRASYGQDADTLVRNLQLILSSEPLKSKESSVEYVDLRFGNRVFYQMKGGVRIDTSTSTRL